MGSVRMLAIRRQKNQLLLTVDNTLIHFVHERISTSLVVTEDHLQLTVVYDVAEINKAFILGWELIVNSAVILHFIQNFADSFFP